MRNYVVMSALLAGLALSACDAAGPAPSLPTLPADVTVLGAATMHHGLTESAMALWRIDLDATSLTAEVTALAQRSGMANDDLYMLPVGRFFDGDEFRIRGVEQAGGILRLNYTITHPFPAPSDPTGLLNGSTNRADLGIAGRLCFLIDVPSATGNTYFSSAVVNTDLIANPDAYWQPNSLLTLTSTANTFPYHTIVEEFEGGGSRDGVSNDGAVTGNYGTDGWTQSEFGPSNDNWTGYGILHQGQISRRDLEIDLATLSVLGTTSLDVALIAKYNDPRQGASGIERRGNRLPPATPDVTKFAYRMPHGALDVERIDWLSESGGLIANTISATTLTFRVVDWDARSSESTASDLSLETDVTLVAPGAAGVPDVDICIPGVLGDATDVEAFDPGDLQDDDSAFGGDVAEDSGQPGDGLFYSHTITNVISSGQTDGFVTGLLRVLDVEDAAGSGYLVNLDADLQPVADPLPAPITYQDLQVELQPEPVTQSGWVRVWGGASGFFDEDVNTCDAAVDPSGNVYVVGDFTNQVEFDRGNASSQRVPNGGDDNYCTKFDRAGFFQWVVTWGGPGFEDASGIEWTPAGHLAISGGFANTCDFDPGPGVANRTSQGDMDGFLLRLNADGTYLSAATYGGTQFDIARALAVDPAGNAYLVGEHRSVVGDYDPGAGTVPPPPFSGFVGAYALKLNASDAFQWVRGWGGANNEAATTVSATANRVWIGGSMQSPTVDFDPGPGVVNRTRIGGLGSGDGYALLLLANGSFEQVIQLGGAGADATTGIACGGNEYGYVTGFWAQGGSLNFDPNGGSVLRTATGPRDSYVAAYDAVGDFIWVQKWGGVTAFESTTTSGIAVNDTYGVRVIGDYGANPDFDPGTGAYNSPSNGQADTYISSFTNAGSWQWTRTWGSSINADGGWAVALDGSTGASYGMGYYAGDTDFEPGPGVTIGTRNGSRDGYVLKLLSNGNW